MVGIRRKILFLTLVPLALALLTISALSINNKSDTEKQLLLHSIDSYRGLLESGDLSFDSLEDKSKLEFFLNEKVIAAEILRSDYSVIYSSENTSVSSVIEEDKDLIDQAFRGVETTFNAIENNISVLEVISPLIINNQVVAVLHEEISYEKSDQRIFQYAILSLSSALLAILFCYIAISILLKNILLNNIYSLKNIVLEIQKGNLNIPNTIETNDEIGDFAKSVDSMRIDIKNSRDKLEQYNKELEDQVKHRTLELNKKVDELEELNKYMINRELTMIDLKKQISKFRKICPESDKDL